MADETGNLEFFCGYDVEGSVEGHFEVAFVVGGEEAHERLLEDGGGEGVGEDEVTASRVWE